MFMKKQNYFFISIVFISSTFVLQSCKEDKNATEEYIESSKEVAVEIFQEKTNVQYVEPIYEGENAEFYMGEYIQSLPQKMRMKKSGSSEVNDTIKSADEIPVTSLTELTQKIYIDGTFSSTLIDKTTDEMNNIENLNVNSQPENEKVHKTEIKDNVMYLYNSEGKLLKSEMIGDVNYKPMLDSLQAYLLGQDSNKSNAPKQRSSNKVNKSLSQAIKSGMKVVSQSETEIVLEMEMGAFSSSLAKRTKSSYSKKAVMRFSPDMTRMYSQKIYEGEQLIQSLEIGFATDDKPQFSNTIKGIENQMFPSANIKFIKQKKLLTKQDGTPFIQTNGEIYSTNTIKYNLTTKKL